jgi:hypothetical protein
MDGASLVNERMRRALLVLAALAVVLGVVALIKARDVGFTEANPATVDPGAVLFGTSDDLPWGKLLQFNPLGALVTLVLGVLALVGAWLRQRWLVIVAAIGFAACAIQVLVQFGRSSNLLGGRGGNLGVFLAFAVGLAVLALTPTAELVTEDRPR